MLAQWPGHERIDAARIGAFGFSAGGFTVLASVGARPDLRRVATHCATSPEFVCDVLRAAGSPLVETDAAVVYGEFDADDRVPYATNAKVVREAIGDAVEFHSVPGAGHLAFLVPCGPLKPPAICTDAGDFDRKAFHASMNAAVVAFFETTLPHP